MKQKYLYFTRLLIAVVGIVVLFGTPLNTNAYEMSDIAFNENRHHDKANTQQVNYSYPVALKSIFNGKYISDGVEGYIPMGTYQTEIRAFTTYCLIPDGLGRVTLFRPNLAMFAQVNLQGSQYNMNMQPQAAYSPQHPSALYTVVVNNNGSFSLKSAATNQYVRVNENDLLSATGTQIGPHEMFKIESLAGNDCNPASFVRTLSPNVCIGGRTCGNKPFYQIDLERDYEVDYITVYARDNIGRPEAVLQLWVDGVLVEEKDVDKRGSNLRFAVRSKAKSIKFISRATNWHHIGQETVLESIQIEGRPVTPSTPLLLVEDEVEICIGGTNYCPEQYYDFRLSKNYYIDRIVVFAHDRIGNKHNASLNIRVDDQWVGVFGQGIDNKNKEIGTPLTFNIGNRGQFIRLRSYKYNGWPKADGLEDAMIIRVLVYGRQ